MSPAYAVREAILNPVVQGRLRHTGFGYMGLPRAHPPG